MKSSRLGLLAAVVLLSACAPSQPTYNPGYYQPAKMHKPRYEQAYYDYYGNYRAGFEREGYRQPGRWHRAQIVGDTNYRQCSNQSPEVAVGYMAQDGDVVCPVIN